MKTIINKTTILSFYLSVIVLNTSCEEFTEVDLPNNMINSELVFNDERTAEAAMTNVYTKLRTSGFLSGGFEGGGCLFGNYTDEIVSYDATNTSFQDFYALTFTSNHTTIEQLWNITYNQIYDVNAIIEGLEKSTNITEIQKKKLISESLLIRSFLHFYLVNSFGDVPYIITTNYDINRSVNKLSKQEIYKKCINDALNAYDNIPNSVSKIRISKFAIQAYLARLYLYDAQYDKAFEMSNELIISEMFPMESLDNTFLKSSNSVIWHLASSNATTNTSEGNTYIFTTIPPPKIALNINFVNGLDASDLRKSIWMKRVSNDSDYYHSYKYKKNTPTSASEEYAVVLRIEEMILTRAEASFRLGNFEQALHDVNRLRQRNNQSLLSTYTNETLWNEIQYQRKYEFFTEYGHRFFDLKRWNLLNEVMSLEKMNWSTHHIVLPIPAKELNLNPKLLPQNNGYL